MVSASGGLSGCSTSSARRPCPWLWPRPSCCCKGEASWLERQGVRAPAEPLPHCPAGPWPSQLCHPGCCQGEGLARPEAPGTHSWRHPSSDSPVPRARPGRLVPRRLVSGEGLAQHWDPPQLPLCPRVLTWGRPRPARSSLQRVAGSPATFLWKEQAACLLAPGAADGRVWAMDSGPGRPLSPFRVSVAWPGEAAPSLPCPAGSSLGAPTCMSPHTHHAHAHTCTCTHRHAHLAEWPAPGGLHQPLPHTTELGREAHPREQRGAENTLKRSTSKPPALPGVWLLRVQSPEPRPPGPGWALALWGFPAVWPWVPWTLGANLTDRGSLS